ncbi:MAG: hypothetical protein ABI771_07135 [Betaproteobacteria bacterium]
MTKERMQVRVREMLVNGTAKSKIFEQLSGQGVKDSQLAYAIAAYANPARRDAHRGKVRILIAIMLIQALIGFIVGFGLGAHTGPNAPWIVGGLLAAIPLAIGWGFYQNLVGAYNACIALTLIQFYRLFDGLASDPIATIVVVAINIGVLALVWYVREKLFPDFAVITPKKLKGRYVFSD